jgi:hypothetical protein
MMSLQLVVEEELVSVMQTTYMEDVMVQMVICKTLVEAGVEV